jgi:uncharacterized protein YjiS (DUF1127 family)
MTAPRRSWPARRCVARVPGLFATTARWWRIRQATAALAGADDSMLRDLGIARSDIEGVVRRGRR